MRNFKLEIEYDGKNYAGWQIQGKIRKRKQKPTIQETIEGVLKRILQQETRLIVSGRTDAGVHAQAQVANFKAQTDITCQKLKVALNGLLPDDIKIARVEEVSLDFHSRFDAKTKVYRYTILNRSYPTALLRNLVYFYPWPLNLGLMQQEARVLLGRHDFSSFQAQDKKGKNAVRNIRMITVSRRKDFIEIEIEADGFLYNMVRNIVGTLIEIGRGNLPKGSIRRILLAKDRRLAGPTAAASGLCLIKVRY